MSSVKTYSVAALCHKHSKSVWILKTKATINETTIKDILYDRVRYFNGMVKQTHKKSNLVLEDFLRNFPVNKEEDFTVVTIKEGLENEPAVLEMFVAADHYREQGYVILTSRFK
jgi:hypothetical protein